MCARTGRPPKGDVAKSKGMHLRLTPSEAERIAKCAEYLKLNRTDAIIYGISLIEREIKK